MSYFQSLINRHGLNRHDGRPLWKYSLTENDFQNLRDRLRLKNPLTLDPRDATLYYAEWWKNNYDGGKPSKQEIFNSLEGNLKFYFSAEEFYQIARKGAEVLNYRWIRKQNTLYFRTLLLQGGLPLNHITNNESSYLDFLLAVLELDPERIEDIMVEPHVIELLPVSSRNEVIYSNCFDIVKSVLNEESTYDDLFNTNKAVKNIAEKLKVRKTQIQRRKRRTRPKNYWLLNHQNGIGEVNLRIGFVDIYEAEELGDVLGVMPNTKQIHFYINDELICVFRKMLNDNYKTHWQHNQNFQWNGESRYPEAYIVIDGERIEVKDFIQVTPNLYEPSLWSKFSEDEWRLMKGNGSPNKEAAVLFPTNWDCSLEALTVEIQEKPMFWSIFEGEVDISKEDERRTYLSDVQSIDWVITTKRPWWMKRASLPVVVGKPEIHVYDEDGKKLSSKEYSLLFRKRYNQDKWHKLEDISFIEIGYFDLKIIKGDIIAYDSFFNIGDLRLNFAEQDSNYAQVQVVSNGFDVFRLDETEVLNITQDGNVFELEVNTETFQIPNTVRGVVGLNGQKKLFFSLESPFEGTCIVDSEGVVIPETRELIYSDLYGFRILSKKNSNAEVTLFNPLAPHVEINKSIKERYQSVLDIDSENEIDKLFYLRDSLNHENKICLRIKDSNQSKTYHINRFSHTLNVDYQFEGKLCLEDSNDELELYAVPVKGSTNEIVAIPLLKMEDHYTFPENIKQKEFVVISSITDGKQLMPRFVSLEEKDGYIEKAERIKIYHKELLNSEFDKEPWEQLLAYFEICNQFNIPYSTFDQIRAISISSEVATRAFLFFTKGVGDMDDYNQTIIPSLEKDLGFCFHWANKKSWENALEEFSSDIDLNYIQYVYNIILNYFQHNNLHEMSNYLFGGSASSKIRIDHTRITELRQSLGRKVLSELPKANPRITNNYGVPIDQHRAVRLLLSAPIAVAESISEVDTEYPIWGQHAALDTIRRNIQYSQSLNPEFYLDTILHVLQRN